MQRRSWASAAALALLYGCHPYGDALQGEFNAGAADPFNFPPAYRSSGGSFTRERGGSGSFAERAAFAHGVPANYFYFPLPPSVVSTPGYPAPSAKADPLRIGGAGALPTSLGFQFEPGDPNAAVQDTASCVAPAGYNYDAFRDDVHYDRQGNLVSALPNANYVVGANPTFSYIPVVQRVSVASAGEACQSVKNDQTIVTRTDVTLAVDGTATPPAPKPDPVYLAWAVIDPGSPVFRVGQNAASTSGYTVQHYGWYRQFLIAYLDGGAVPTAQATTATGAPITRMVTQKLYFPRGGVTAKSGNGIGVGNDVVEHVRGEAGYSPVCQTYSYVVPAGSAPLKDAAAIEASAAALSLQPGAPIDPKTGAPTPAYIFCLQAL